MFAIELNDIWKKYHIKYNRRRSLKETFLNFLKDSHKSEFWALKGIFLNIRKGETIGIIGRNGSGKTTLLKLIGGITKATKGSVRINGQAVGLLELGAGFQEDLTGRENIYINGSLLGLTKRDIARSLDSIIEFADIGDFIDAPMRVCSYGMYLRLGFAVAVHAKSDIMLIDELLSVGDIGFQEKCCKKIAELKKSGVTIVIVSHNLSLINRFCDRVGLLDSGRIIIQDHDKQKVFSRYLSLLGEEERRNHLPNQYDVMITNVYFKNNNSEIAEMFKSGKKMSIAIEYYARKKIANPVFGIGIYGVNNAYLMGPNTRDDDYHIDYIEGRGKITYTLNSLPLNEGAYRLSVSIHDVNEAIMYDYHEQIYKFYVNKEAKKTKYGMMVIKGEWLKT